MARLRLCETRAFGWFLGHSDKPIQEASNQRLSCQSKVQKPPVPLHIRWACDRRGPRKIEKARQAQHTQRVASERSEATRPQINSVKTIYLAALRYLSVL